MEEVLWEFIKGANFEPFYVVFKNNLLEVVKVLFHEMRSRKLNSLNFSVLAGRYGEKIDFGEERWAGRHDASATWNPTYMPLPSFTLQI